jgi:NADPH-dependent 2,4-dienoyl-CoA reductase/sulfur reductase-like enzyme
VVGLGDNDYGIQKAEDPKKVVVVGAGPAGMEAARIAAMRGHSVTLLEKENKLGGQINLAIIPPHKKNIKPLPDYYAKQLELNQVDVKLETEATREVLNGLKPDAIIFATGSVAAKPEIAGADKPVVRPFEDVLMHSDPRRDMVIIGGGTIGCELAETLARKDKCVTVIEMTNELAAKMAKTAQSVLIGQLDHLGVTVHVNAEVTGIENDRVDFVKNNEHMYAMADTVVLCVGEIPDDTLYKECRGDFKEVYNIGDSSTVGDIRLAVRAGYEAGIKV